MTAVTMSRLGARSGRLRGLSLLFGLLVLGGCEAGQQAAADPLAVAAADAGEA